MIDEAKPFKTTIELAAELTRQAKTPLEREAALRLRLLHDLAVDMNRLNSTREAGVQPTKKLLELIHDGKRLTGISP